MDFDDTPEEAKFRAECRAWLERNAELRPADEADTGLMDERSDPATVKRAQQWQAKKADGGWACITWPREVGGRGGTASQSVVWRQEESRYKTPPDIFAIGLGMLGPTLMAHGTDGQKQRYLRPMLRGEEIWCQLFSEPAAGSDLAGLNTRAVRDGDSWVVNGQKIWTTGAQYSKWGMVLTRTDLAAAKHAGISYFVVDMQSPGIEIRPIKQINGGQSFNQVFFTDVRIPHENVVGKVNDGWRGAITTLMNERASIGSGTGGPGFRDLLRLAKETDWNGRPALEDPAVRQRLAEFYVKTKGLQYTGYRTQTALSHGQTPGPEASIGKLVGAPLRQQMASFALELQGLAGTLADEAIAPHDATWQRSWLGAPGLRLAGGTDEILRNIVAERVLRLPGEPRMDKDLPFQAIPTGVPSR